MMPRYYINDLGGAAGVNVLIGLAPSNYETKLRGLVTEISEQRPRIRQSGLPAVVCRGRAAHRQRLTAQPPL